MGDNIENPGVVSLSEALKIADSLDLDLVEISPKADPPVCRAIDYQKFLYQQKKKQKEMKSKATKIVVKEMAINMAHCLKTVAMDPVNLVAAKRGSP